MAAPWADNVRLFTIPSTSRCQPAPLPALTSPEYAEAYNEVKSLGSNVGTTRTPHQNFLVRFYGDNFLVQWNRTLRDVANLYQFDPGRKARLLALANMSAADAFICAWNSKKFFNFWRPITAIREGDHDGNAQTAGQTNWTPAITTPPYPDYTSGANNLSGSITRILELVFDTDRVNFTISSLSGSLLMTDPATIEYQRFSDVAKDIIDVRIWQGIHFRFADTEARSQGRRVANYAFKNFLQPVDAAPRWNMKGRWNDDEW
jgi:hypothetical protein